MVPEAQPPGAKDCVHGDSRFVSLPSLRPAFVPLTGSRIGYYDDPQVCEPDSQSVISYHHSITLCRKNAVHAKDLNSPGTEKLMDMALARSYLTKSQVDPSTFSDEYNPAWSDEAWQ